MYKFTRYNHVLHTGNQRIPEWAWNRPGETRDYDNGILSVVFCREPDDPESPGLIRNGEQWEVISTLTGPSFHENEKKNGTAQRTFAGKCISDFEAALSKEPDWLIPNLISMTGPNILAGPSKTLKTADSMDLAVSVGSGTQYLNHFPVCQRRKVLYITGETNEAQCARRLNKCLKSKGLGFYSDIDLHIEYLQFPKILDPIEVMRLANTVHTQSFEVVIIDPLYRGLAGADMSSLTEVGPSILELQQALSPALLILSHHSTKASAKQIGKPLNLEDVSGAGVAESMAAWNLRSRYSEYKHDGQHQIIVNMGSRDTNGGLYLYEFNDDEWGWKVTPLHEFKQRQRERNQEIREDVK